MITDMKAAAGALGAKTARACDSCLRRRARWFCGADDAFLCHGCDNLVHSANQLACRHERVRLQTASCKVTAQAWHSGFTRKARTPRHNKHLALQQRLKEEVLFNSTCVLPVVPELGVEEPLLDVDESEEQLLCRVPVFDPFDAELCSVYNEVKNYAGGGGDEDGCDLDNFSEFLPSDMDLAEFAADVETLLGSGFDEEVSPGHEKKRSSESEVVFDCKEDQGVVIRDACLQGEEAKSTTPMVKVEDDEEEELDSDTACHLESVLDMTNDAFDWNIESVLSPSVEEEKKTALPAVEAAANTNSSGSGNGVEVKTKRDIFLRLNYEEVITAWASQGCPWTTGNPPKFNSDIDDCWPNCLDSSGVGVQFSSYGGMKSLRGQLVGSGDGGREARVSRYREKRRTRLFAKKIRYEVRKLNAEKRPRMKGRFVKRVCFVGANSAAAFPAYH